LWATPVLSSGLLHITGVAMGKAHFNIILCREDTFWNTLSWKWKWMEYNLRILTDLHKTYVIDFGHNSIKLIAYGTCSLDQSNSYPVNIILCTYRTACASYVGQTTAFIPQPVYIAPACISSVCLPNLLWFFVHWNHLTINLNESDSIAISKATLIY